ncbi:MAG: hypothetical protein KAU03_05235 [Candidatus Altiarchaeales archaeon]|nr:hypothetical protein [Candidatus Altiarchaeales archaeon]
MVSVTFECGGCGRTTWVEDPTTMEIPCGCGGKMLPLTVLSAGMSSEGSRRSRVFRRQAGDEPSTIMSLVFNKEKPAISNDTLKELLPYKAVMCPHCGTIHVTKGEKCFRCRRCEKTSSFRKRGQWNVRLHDFISFQEAGIFAKKWAFDEGISR